MTSRQKLRWLIAGIAALVLSHCEYTVGGLRDALLRSAVVDSALVGLTQSGARLNAANAVRSCDVAPPGGDVVVHCTKQIAAACAT